MPSGVNPGDNASATATAGAATCNHTGSRVTTEALTTAADADYTLTLSNSLVYPDSVVVVSVSNGTNTKGPCYAHSVAVSAGQVVVKVRNTHATDALNGTLVINVLVL